VPPAQHQAGEARHDGGEKDANFLTDPKWPIAIVGTIPAIRFRWTMPSCQQETIRGSPDGPAKSFLGRAAGLGRVDKLNPDADGGKQHECGEALGQFVVAGGDPT
jgi:hypothetical protein